MQFKELYEECNARIEELEELCSKQKKEHDILREIITQNEKDKSLQEEMEQQLDLYKEKLYIKEEDEEKMKEEILRIEQLWEEEERKFKQKEL